MCPSFYYNKLLTRWMNALKKIFYARKGISYLNFLKYLRYNFYN